MYGDLLIVNGKIEAVQLGTIRRHTIRFTLIASERSGHDASSVVHQFSQFAADGVQSDADGLIVSPIHRHACLTSRTGI